MKPLLVLIAVAAAAAGLFFVLQGGDKSPQDGQGLAVTVSNTTVDAPAETTTEDEASLVGISTGGDRTEAATQVQPTVATQQTDDLSAVLGFGQLTGLVTDAKGQPIQDAKVTLTRYGSQSFFFDDIDRSTDVVATTNSEGVYAFERVEAYDGYALIATHPDYSRTENSNVIIQDGNQTDAPALVLVPGRMIHGIVTDTGGNAVPNATLKLNENMMMAAFDGSQADAEAVTTTTDKLGKYEFKNVSPGQNYVIEVSADGYGGINTPPLAVLETDDTTHDIKLEVASMLAGLVTSTSGEVIQGVTIQAYLVDKSKPSTNSSTVSDETGYFEITDIPPGDFQIVARHPLFKPDARSRAKSGDMNVTIELEPLPRVSGRIVDFTTGAPLTTFEVQLRQPVAGGQNELSTADPSTRMTVKDPEGRFELVVPRAGDFMVEGIAPGYANSTSEAFTTVMGANAPTITVRMTKGGTLTGRVVGSNGQPLAGATVATHDKEWSDDLFWQSLGAGAPGSATETTVRTGDDGTYTIPFLTPASYQLVVRHRDYAQEIMKDLTVTEGQTSRVADCVLPVGAELSGTIIGPGGSPLAGATVKMFPTTPNAKTYTAQTNKNGEYRIKNVRQGSYKVHATRPRTAADNPFQENIDLKNTQRTVTVQNGSNLAGQDFKLTDR
ncbi:Cna protein B-type domain protein [Planctomycetes bacterium Poly30]|uniref:Cna protein B-type domain protein n=1 Tax=Saltatorellus ferox TaxID=2528018 RepID=A0A518EQQ7_9BACT|nr:Cna protein B-type domain protein [Planctomycetes bacterium Poly30]